ncbi:Kae1-associated serine/threonine protein kinase [Candidatus Woesearchaeota archaeon]|nr:Kae1-associated serine/threonine protein kinase [Candidatus Woesearchaeota archaeon]
MKLIAEGAEASIYLAKHGIIKKRRRKSYRIKELDYKLRMFRTRREAKIMEKLAELNVAAPKVSSADSTAIEMSFIDGKKARDILSSGNCVRIGKEIGKTVAALHKNRIIHGDLTTSNMINSKGKLYLIDFGLGFFSDKTEDKAVDLHLLRQALNSSHSRIAKKCFDAAVKSYCKSSRSGSEVLKRLEKVEGRGRYKGKLKA